MIITFMSEIGEGMELYKEEKRKSEECNYL